MPSSGAMVGFLVAFLILGVGGLMAADTVMQSELPATTSWNETGAQDTQVTEMQSMQESVTESFSIAVTIMKVIVILVVATIIFQVLQWTGILPSLDTGLSEHAAAPPPPAPPTTPPPPQQAPLVSSRGQTLENPQHSSPAHPQPPKPATRLSRVRRIKW